jgi:chromate transporter
MAIVALAVWRIGKKALRNSAMWGIATFAFVGIFFFKLPFPLIVVSAGIIGFVLGKISNNKFSLIAGHQSDNGEAKGVLDDNSESPDHAQPSWAKALKICGVWLLLWSAPIILAGYLVGWDQTVFREGVFFAKAAVVTFGGAYAVLPYVAQQAVEHYHWQRLLGLLYKTIMPLLIA